MLLELFFAVGLKADKSYCQGFGDLDLVFGEIIDAFDCPSELHGGGQVAISIQKASHHDIVHQQQIGIVVETPEPVDHIETLQMICVV